jgi:ribosomal protein S18
MKKMKKQLFLLLTTIITLNSYSQIVFEKGYYINNSNQRIDCLIKNIDWKNNPVSFQYKTSENSNSKTITIKLAKEFGIYNTSKYYRTTVQIDRSSKNVNYLSLDRNPIFKEEELFLKVLLEGKSNLYEYSSNNLIRYFYNKENADIEQLIFKNYKTKKSTIRKNNRFRQQLWNNVRCPNMKMSEIKRIDYKKSDLLIYFTEFNKCNNHELTYLDQKNEKILFSLTLRPRVNNSSLKMQDHATNTLSTDFGTKIGIGFGLEAEFLLPFNKNKWSLLVEPTYRSFKSKKPTNINGLGGTVMAEIDYNSVELPIGLRHYFFLNNSKFFVNASFVFDFSYKSSLEFTRGSDVLTFEINKGNNWAAGIGYKYNDKYSLEISHQANRELLQTTTRVVNYRTFSVIFGYTLF